MAAIGDGTELTFVEKTGLPHLGCGLGRQIEREVAILIHRDLPLCKVDAVGAQQSLHPGKTLLLNDRGHPRIARAISDALCSTLSHFDLVPRRVGERPDETIEAGCLARRDPRSCGALRKAEILRLPSLLADPRSGARSVKTDLALGVEPHVVYPGNLQGRNIRETGPKGAVLVEVADRQVTSVVPVELDVLRWSKIEVDCTDARINSVTDLIRSALGSALPTEGAGRPLIVRVALHGSSEIAGTLKDRAAELRDEVCAIATSISPDLWIEKVVSEVTSPHAAQEPEAGLDFAEIIEEAHSDPELMAELRMELEPFLVSARSSLGAPEEDELRALAEAGSWDRILEASATALRSRLVGDA